MGIASDFPFWSDGKARTPYSGGGAADGGNDSVILGWRCAPCVTANLASFDSRDAFGFLLTPVPGAARGFRGFDVSFPSVAVAVDDFAPSISFFLRGLEIFLGADVSVTLTRFDFVVTPPPSLESIFPLCEGTIASGWMSDGENDIGFVGERGDGGDDRPGEELWTSRGRRTSAVGMIFCKPPHHHSIKHAEICTQVQADSNPMGGSPLHARYRSGVEWTRSGPTVDGGCRDSFKKKANVGRSFQSERLGKENVFLEAQAWSELPLD